MCAHIPSLSSLAQHARTSRVARTCQVNTAGEDVGEREGDRDDVGEADSETALDDTVELDMPLPLDAGVALLEKGKVAELGSNDPVLDSLTDGEADVEAEAPLEALPLPLLLKLQVLEDVTLPVVDGELLKDEVAVVVPVCDSVTVTELVAVSEAVVVDVNVGAREGLTDVLALVVTVEEGGGVEDVDAVAVSEEDAVDVEVPLWLAVPVTDGDGDGESTSVSQMYPNVTLSVSSLSNWTKPAKGRSGGGGGGKRWSASSSRSLASN